MFFYIMLVIDSFMSLSILVPIPVLVFVLFMLSILFVSFLQNSLFEQKKLKDVDHLRISFQDIKEATKSFTTFIGKSGRYGSVYKGELSVSGKLTSVAIKRLQNNISNHVFVRETHLISSCKHSNLVSLLGFCQEDHNKFLIYEYVKHGNLKDYLSTLNATRALTWMQRLDICINAARGLDYLHKHKVPHGDIDSSNVLLGQNWKAMIANHGLSRIGNASRTFAYLYPTYMRARITKNYDVYSFGVVLLEVLCGRLVSIKVENEQQSLVPLAKHYYEVGKLNEIIDVRLKTEVDSDSLKRFAEIAYECLEDDKKRRPSMGLVVKKLEEILKLHVS